MMKKDRYGYAVPVFFTYFPDVAERIKGGGKFF
jgi:hypothetical protein